MEGIRIWTHLFLLWMGIFINPVFSGCKEECHTSCRFESQKTTINCSNQALTSIPSCFPMHSTKIILSNNMITTISWSDFSDCNNVKELYLHKNNLSSIQNGSFDGMPHLQLLWLSNNHLNFTDESNIPRGSFAGLAELKYLRMEKNSPHSMSYNGDILRNKSALKALSLDGIQGVPLPSEFGELLNLSSLSLYGNLTTLDNTTFRHLNCTSLSELYIRGKTLHEIQHMAFGPLSNLTMLSLSDSSLLDLNRTASRGWGGLENTKIEKLVLNHIMKNSPLGNTLGADSLPNTNQAPKLKELYLNSNGLSNLPGFEVHRFPSLEILHLEHNMFNPVKVLKQLRNMTNLKNLNLAKQKRFCDITQGFESDSEENIILELSPQLDVLNLSFAFAGRFSKKLPALKIKNGSRKMKVLDLSENFISIASGPLQFVGEHCELKVLNMSFCHISSMNNSFFGVNSNVAIDTLNLSYSMLGKYLNGDRDGRFFKQFKDVKVKTLDLTMNNIKYLYKHCFKHFRTLEVLILRDNAIHFWTAEMKYAKYLKSIDLSYNSLSLLSKGQIYNDLAHGRSYALKVDLSNNPLQARCYTLDFLNILLHPKSNIIQFENKYSYQIFQGNKAYNFSSLPELLPELTIECSARTWVISASVSMCVLFFTMCLIVFILRHRWDIRYFLLRLTKDRKQYQAFERQSSCLYDAFVSYHQEDFHWIRHQLMVNLEEKRSFKLCVHFRDWLPGPTIEDNVCESVTNSRWTVVVLSKKFLCSGWCDFELQMARMRGFDVGHDMIIVIALEEIPLSEMSTTLSNLRRSNTWLQWPEDESDIENFWDVLSTSLARPGDRPARCGCGRTFYPDGTVAV